MNYLSLFSGMEAAHLAWHPLGWNCVGVAEIDPSACALLRHRLPHVPNLGSVTDITDEAIAKLGRIDVVIGGSPCQDLSVAGKRRGFAEGTRSSLFHQQIRIFHAARTFCGARFLVWENVPGAFSSNRGRDFAVVVGEMAGTRLLVPRDGWGNEGVALGRNGLVEWGVLDAQWFGVAQRRRRVFAVLDTGNWSGRSPVLLERDSLRGDSPPRRESREDVAPCLAARTGGGGGLGTDAEIGGAVGVWPAEVASTLNAHFGDKLGLENQHALNGAPLFVPVAFDTTQITSAANRSNPQPDDPCHPLAAAAHPPAIAFSCKDHAADAADDLSPTLRAMGHGASHANAGGQVAVAIAVDCYNATVDEHATGTLRAGNGNELGGVPAAMQGMAVRRLTPRECERLQGAEDDWTLVPNAKGKPMADGPRYKMLGNSFAVPVINWIGRQLDRAVQESS